MAAKQGDEVQVAQVTRLAATSLGSPRSLLLPFTASSVRECRRLMRADLRAAGLQADLGSNALTVVSELLGNSIRHAHPLPDKHVRVEWRITSHAVEMRVTDGGGSRTPKIRHADPTATGGRGLAIVNALSRDWGVDAGESDSTVWAVLDLP
jgi:serine/threonine-protein kinase RsbW